MSYNNNSFPTTKTIISIVDEYESVDKSAVLEDILNMLTADQRLHILTCLVKKAPLLQFPTHSQP